MDMLDESPAKMNIEVMQIEESFLGQEYSIVEVDGGSGCEFWVARARTT